MKEKIISYVKKYYVYLGVVLITVISLLLAIDPKVEENPNINEIIGSENQYETYIYIDIRGSVLNPGVYKVEEGTRLFQLISRAGGLTPDANEMEINQSLLLIDESFVYVPNINEEFINTVNQGDNIDAEKININSSTKTELETLPGIGPSTAQSIIDYRNDIEEFTLIEDIMKVPGIGEATYNEIKDLITT